MAESKVSAASKSAVDRAADALLGAERESERMEREARKVAAAAAISAKKDSTVKGTVDMWPLLRLETPDLVAKIVAGECDGILTELGEMAAAHPGLGPKGMVPRGTVIDAVKARLKKA